MENNKGITLIALTIMIIIMLILVAITTTTGLNVIKESRYNKAVAEMKTMQAKVNELYDEYKEGKLEPTNYGTQISSSIQADANVAYNSVQSSNSEIGEFQDFRFYSADYIKNTLDVDGVDGDYIINIKTRTVIYLDGIEIDDYVFYSLDEIEGEQFNVR